MTDGILKSPSHSKRWLSKKFHIPGVVARQKGFTLLEVLLATAISAVLVLALSGLTGRAITAWQYSHERQELLYQGEFALTLITDTMRQAQTLTLPTDNNPGDILELILDPAIDPVADPVIYYIVGSQLYEQRHGTERIIAEAAQLNFQIQQLTIPGANATKIAISITLTGLYSSAIILNNEVMLGVGG